MNRAYKTVCWFMLILAVGTFVVYMCEHFTYVVDYTNSSELLLANLLAHEKSILSRHWFYSTELRVLNTQLVFAPLFLITQNWHVVRIIGTILLCLIFLGSVSYYCRNAGIKKYFPILGTVLLLPLSENYVRYVLIGLYYIPHIVISFLALGLSFNYMNCGDRKKKAALFVCAVLLSLGAGMGGLRQLLILYIPLSAAAFIGMGKFCNQPAKALFQVSFGEICASCAGFLINTAVLSKFYEFTSWNNINFNLPKWEMLGRIVNDFLCFYGYREGNAFSSALLHNGSVLLLLLLVSVGIYFTLKDEECTISQWFICVFFLIQICTFSALYLVTDTWYVDRYNIPILVFAFPVLAQNLTRIGAKLPYKCAGSILLIVILVLCGAHGYIIEWRKDKTKDLRVVAEYLTSHDYLSGYATAWNSNVLTELTNGAIEVWHWFHSDGSNVHDVNNIAHWLQPKSHADTRPKDRVFVLFSHGENQKAPMAKKMSQENVVFNRNNYIIYGYNSIEELLADLSQ